MISDNQRYPYRVQTCTLLGVLTIEKDISTGTNFSSANYGIKLFSIDLQHAEFTSGAEFKVANPSLHPTAVRSPSPRCNKKQSPELSMCSVSWSDTNSNSKLEPPMELLLHLVRKKKKCTSTQSGDARPCED
jgi:hypothetical protein